MIDTQTEREFLVVQDGHRGRGLQLVDSACKGEVLVKFVPCTQTTAALTLTHANKIADDMDKAATPPGASGVGARQRHVVVQQPGGSVYAFVYCSRDMGSLAMLVNEADTQNEANVTMEFDNDNRHGASAHYVANRALPKGTVLWSQSWGQEYERDWQPSCPEAKRRISCADPHDVAEVGGRRQSGRKRQAVRAGVRQKKQPVRKRQRVPHGRANRGATRPSDQEDACASIVSGNGATNIGGIRQTGSPTRTPGQCNSISNAQSDEVT